MIDPEAIIEARRALGRQLAAYRDAASLNQHQLALLISYGRSTVANAETGYSTCSRAFWDRSDEALGADGGLIRAHDEFMALVRQQRADVARLVEAERVAKYRQLHTGPSSTNQATGQPYEAWTEVSSADTVDDVKRRAAIALPALSLFAAAARPAEPWNRLTHVLEHPHQLDESTLEDLEGYTTELFRREEHLPSRQLATRLHMHVDRLERLLTDPPVELQHRLLSTAGEALALAGWVAWDSKNIAKAYRLYDKALNAARQAGDGPLLACVLAYQSYGAEADGNMPLAQQLLVEAQAHVRGERNAASRAWLAAREAEVNSGLADEMAALRALDRAMTAYDYARPHRERSWTGFFTPTRLGSMAVTTYARLDHAELDATTDSVVASLPSVDAKIKAVILADVASAAIQCGRHDRGAQLGHEALDQTITQEASLGTQRLRDLHLMIRNKRDVAVLAELNNRLLAYVG